MFANFQRWHQIDQHWVAHTLEVLLSTEKLNRRLLEAEVNAQSYGLTLEQPYLDAYQAAVQDLASTQGQLLQQVRDNPEQYDRLRRLEDLLVRSIITLDGQLLSLGAAEAYEMTAEELFLWLSQARDVLTLTRAQLQEFAALETRYLQERQARLQARYRWSQASLYLLTLVGLTAIAGAVVLFNRQDQELRSRSRQLEMANEQLWRFAANASHELRAPLAAVLSNAQVGLMLLQSPGVDAEAQAANYQQSQDCLVTVVATAKRMSRLVQDLLQLARSQGGTLTLTQTDIVALLQQWAEPGDPPVLLLTLPREPVWIKADAGLLKQALGNMIENAKRYARTRVEVRLTAAPLVIEIQDDGPGIDPKHLPYIFEPFYRVGSEGGFGLGLAIAKQVIEAHGGQVTVTSLFGQGTTFRVELPSSSPT
ncbi:MAG: ATP-binding protein [Thermostichus sp. DG02_5_bins_236]